MSQLLASAPFVARDETAFIGEMNELCRWHLGGCEAYRRVWPGWRDAKRVEDLPFLHVGVFKHQLWKTNAPGIVHQRTLHSSSTSGANASLIILDERSSALQTQSSAAILGEMLGGGRRPVAVLDAASSLRQRGEATARITAALSLRPWAQEMCFLLDGAEDPKSLQWERLLPVLARGNSLIVYGFTWMLWLAWASASIPEKVRQQLATATVHFVHSGGWKKLEAARVRREQFDEALLSTAGPGSKVLDYYGLVEQVGLVFPLCECGYRHVPRWAEAVVRDPWTLNSLQEREGLLQFLNVLSWGAPYHSVLTEDVGRLVSGSCACGRLGQRFELLGRVPKAEMRGCSNV